MKLYRKAQTVNTYKLDPNTSTITSHTFNDVVEIRFKANNAGGITDYALIIEKSDSADLMLQLLALLSGSDTEKTLADFTKVELLEELSNRIA